MFAAASASLAASDWDMLLKVNKVNAVTVSAGPPESLRGYKWHRVDTARFRLYFMDGVRVEHVRQVAERVDNIWAFLHRRTGATVEPPIVALLPADRSAYDKLIKPYVTRRRSVQFPGPQDVVGRSVVAIDTHGYVDRLASIMYETAHLFAHARQEQSQQDAQPWRWWSEEFMCRYCSMGLERVFAVIRPRQELYAMWFRLRPVPRWDSLDDLSARYVHPRRRPFEFSIAESVLHFLEQTYGEAKLTAFWRAAMDARVERFSSTEAIFVQAFGKGFDALEREFHKYYSLGLPAWYVSAAQDAYEHGLHQQALALATAVIDSAPPNSLRYALWRRVWGLAGACLSAQGLQGEAEAYFEAAAMTPETRPLGPELDPFGPRSIRRRPQPYSEEDQHLPDDENALAAVASALLRSGKANIAVQAYRKLANGFPNSPRAASYYFNYGQLLKRIGKTDDAVCAWEVATRYPNSYHAMRAHIYLGRRQAELGTTKAKAQARRHFLAALDTVVTGPNARNTPGLQRWARRELRKLKHHSATTVRPNRASAARYPRLAARSRRYTTMADAVAVAVGASPQQHSHIAVAFEKCRSLQLATWARLADASAGRATWLAVQDQLLADRRREIERLLDERQKVEFAVWLIERLPTSELQDAAPIDEADYSKSKLELNRWAQRWRKTKLDEFAAHVQLDAAVQAELQALLAKHRSDTAALWRSIDKGLKLTQIAKRQRKLDKRFDAQVAKLLGQQRAASFQRWLRAQQDQLPEYNGIIRQSPPPTEDDL